MGAMLTRTRVGMPKCCGMSIVLGHAHEYVSMAPMAPTGRAFGHISATIRCANLFNLTNRVRYLGAMLTRTRVGMPRCLVCRGLRACPRVREHGTQEFLSGHD